MDLKAVNLSRDLVPASDSCRYINSFLEFSVAHYHQQTHSSGIGVAATKGFSPFRYFYVYERYQHLLRCPRTRISHISARKVVKEARTREENRPAVVTTATTIQEVKHLAYQNLLRTTSSLINQDLIDPTPAQSSVVTTGTTIREAKDN